MRWPFVFAMILGATTAQAMPGHEGHKLGKVDFPVSCGVEAQRRFTLATSWLHSFEYDEAEKEYRAAIEADPACAMAYWGVAMSRFHPLWAAPSLTDLETGKGALHQARRIKPKTERERAYIDALSAFYGDSGKHDHGARTTAYANAMERLHLTYPNDQEAAIFYALALLAVGVIDADENYAQEKKAAGILNSLLGRLPEHPGLTHYLIHGYDYPALAHLALPAARTYAGIAPASAHAQHMPSHIFTRLGLWQESILSNRQAEAAAIAYARSTGLTGAWDEQLHAIDYLAYAHLQLGKDDDARAVLERLSAIQRVDPPNFKAAYTFSAVPARFALERRAWREAASIELSPASRAAIPWAQFSWAQANIHFARAIGAARSGDLAAARQETGRLDAIKLQLTAKSGEYDWGQQVEIQRQIAAAWVAWAAGRRADAVDLMRKAAELDETTEKHPVTPGSILPGREQLGELLLTSGRPAEALVAFEECLKRAPGRFNSILGAARAARQSGNMEKARYHFSTLADLRSPAGGDRREINEAAQFIAGALPVASGSPD